jgi:hypothetical protein
MSGYTEAAALENARVGKDVVLLNKPFSTDTLVRKISQVQEATSTVPDKTSAPSS